MQLIDDKGITLQCEAEEGICCYGSRELLLRLITNLLSNAYRYGRENGHIFISLRQTEEQIRLEVADDGVGIAPESLPQIIDRFYQEDNSRSGTGTGLGLAIAREIAHLHNGEIEAESRLGQGSRFIFTLPQKKLKL